MCFQFRFKCRYSDVEVISDGARKGIPDHGSGIVIRVYSSLRGLTAPAIRLRADLRRVLNVFLIIIVNLVLLLLQLTTVQQVYVMLSPRALPSTSVLFNTSTPFFS